MSIDIITSQINIQNLTIVQVGNYKLEILLCFHLAPDGGDPVLISKQGVHVHAVLNNQGCDRDQGKHLQT